MIIFLRVIRLRNGLVACLISDKNGIVNLSDLSESSSEGSDEDTEDESAGSDLMEPDEVDDTRRRQSAPPEQKMVNCRLPL